MCVSKIAVALIRHLLKSSKAPCCTQCGAPRSPPTPRSKFTQTKTELIISQMVDSMSAMRTPVQSTKQRITPAKSYPNIAATTTEDTNNAVSLAGSALPNANSTTNVMENAKSNYLQVPSATAVLSASATCKRLGSDSGAKVNGPEKQCINIVTRTRRIGVDITNNPSLVTGRNIKQNKLAGNNPYLVLNGKDQDETHDLDLDLENHNPSPRLRLIKKMKGLHDQAESPNVQIPFICVTPPAESMHEAMPPQQPRPSDTSAASVQVGNEVKADPLIARKRKLTRQTNISIPVPPHQINNNDDTKEEAISVLKTTKTNSDSTEKELKSKNKFSNGNAHEYATSHVCICKVTDNGDTNGAVSASNVCDDQSDTAAKNTLSSFFRNAFLGSRRRASKSPTQNNDQDSTPPQPPTPAKPMGANSDASPVQDGLANALSSMALVTNSSR